MYGSMPTAKQRCGKLDIPFNFVSRVPVIPLALRNSHPAPLVTSPPRCRFCSDQTFTNARFSVGTLSSGSMNSPLVRSRSKSGSELPLRTKAPGCLLHWYAFEGWLPLWSQQPEVYFRKHCVSCRPPHQDQRCCHGEELLPGSPSSEPTPCVITSIAQCSGTESVCK